VSTPERNIEVVLEDSGPDFETFSFERPTAGHQGEVFLVTLEYAGESYEVVVKFDNGEGQFAVEPFLHDYVADRTDLPVPRILVFEKRPDLNVQPYFVTERIQGENLAQALGQLDSETRGRVLEHVGAILGDMHSEIGFEGFGHLGLDDGRLVVNECCWDWQGFFQKLVEHYIDRLADTPFADLQRPATQYLDDNVGVIESTGVPRLVHDDFRPANMLFDPTSSEPVTAVLDWQFVLAGDPEYHLARTDFLFIDPAFRDGSTRERLRERLYEGYRTHMEFEPTAGYEQRRAVYHFATLVWRMASFDVAFADFSDLAQARAEARFRKQFDQLVSIQPEA
jgi:aminoglycoside phosphotransferase (APT) family kinase protein